LPDYACLTPGMPSAMGAFARDHAQRKEWRDERLWLQMVLITAICIIAGFLAGLGAGGTVAFTATFVAAVYVLTRRALRQQQRP
jgi:hypothetical protein